MEHRKSEFIFFSKSYWDEPPRMRHQLTNLLRSEGHKVYFFERPVPFWSEAANNRAVSSTLELLQSKELVNHQLRVFSFVRKINASYEKRNIYDRLSAISQWEKAIVINFNYDYFFLRELFKENRIVTIINDDFEAQAKLFSGAHVRDVQPKTCAISDKVLTVSYPLKEQLKGYCEPALFFPWAQEEYVRPEESSKRTILIWAYIRKDFDFEFVEKLLRDRKQYSVRFVGPADSEARAILEDLSERYDNIEVLGSSTLQDVKLDDVFVSLIPYKSNIGYVNAITVSNKTFQLTSKGVPIVTYNMNNFVEAEGILNAFSVDKALSYIDFCFDNFWSLQEGLKAITEENNSRDRYRMIMNSVK